MDIFKIINGEQSWKEYSIFLKKEKNRVQYSFADEIIGEVLEPVSKIEDQLRLA